MVTTATDGRRDLLTVGEAARLLGCSPRRVSELADLGVLPHRRLPGGRGWPRIERAAVEDMAREMERPSTTRRTGDADRAA